MKTALQVTPGITWSAHHGGDQYTGSREALIAAKLAQPDWFVLDRWNYKGQIRFKRFKKMTVSGRSVTLHILNRARCELWIQWPAPQQHEGFQAFRARLIGAASDPSWRGDPQLRAEVQDLYRGAAR